METRVTSDSARGKTARPTPHAPYTSTERLPFGQLPHAIASDPRLDGNAIRVAVGLLYYACGRPTCWVSNEKIGDYCGLSRSSVKRSIGELEAAGHVVREAVSPTLLNMTGRQLRLRWLESQDYLASLPVPDRRAPTRGVGRPIKKKGGPANEKGGSRSEQRGVQPRTSMNTVDVVPERSSVEGPGNDRGGAPFNGHGPSQAPPVTDPLPDPWPPPTPSQGDPFAAILNRFPDLQAAPSEQSATQTHLWPAAQPPPRSSVGPVGASWEQEGAEDRTAADPPARRPARATQTPEHKLEHEVAELIKLLDDPVARDYALRHLQRLGRLPADPVAEPVAAKVVPPESAPEPDPFPVVEPPPLVDPVPAPPREAPSSAYESHLAKAQAGAAARAAAQASHRERLKSALANPKFKGDQDLLARLCEVGPGMTSSQVSRLAVGLANALNDGKSQARYAQLLWSISEGRLDRLLLAMAYVQAVEARNQKGWPLGKVMGGRLKELVPIFF